MTGSALPRIALLALIWGSAFLWIKLADWGFSPVEVTLARLALGAAALFAILLARREKIPHGPMLWAHIAVAALGIIGTGFAYVLNYQIITSEGATVASTVTYLLPVVAIVLGVLVLGENVTAIMLAGIALVLLGVALTRRRTDPASDEHRADLCS